MMRVDKVKLSGLWDWTVLFLSDQKNKELTWQLVSQETDQNHMDVPKKIEKLNKQLIGRDTDQNHMDIPINQYLVQNILRPLEGWDNQSALPVQ